MLTPEHRIRDGSTREIIDSFRSIKEDLFLTAYASYVVELLDKGTEERNVNPFYLNLCIKR